MPDYRPMPFEIGDLGLVGGVEAGARLAQVLGQLRSVPGGMLQARQNRAMIAEEGDKTREFQAGEAEKQRQFQAGETEKAAARNKEDFKGQWQAEVQALVQGGMPEEEAKTLVLEKLRAGYMGDVAKLKELETRIEGNKVQTAVTAKAGLAQDEKDAQAMAESKARIRQMDAAVAVAKTDQEKQQILNQFLKQREAAEIAGLGAQTSETVASTQQKYALMQQGYQQFELAKQQLAGQNKDKELDNIRQDFAVRMEAAGRVNSTKIRASVDALKLAEERLEQALGTNPKFDQSADPNKMPSAQARQHLATMAALNDRNTKMQDVRDAIAAQDEAHKVAYDEFEKRLSAIRAGSTATTPAVVDESEMQNLVPK